MIIIQCVLADGIERVHLVTPCHPSDHDTGDKPCQQEHTDALTRPLKRL